MEDLPGRRMVAFGAIMLMLVVVIAALNAIAQLTFQAHDPAWSLTMVAIDVVVIYALVRYGTVLGEVGMVGPRHDDSYHRLPHEGPAAPDFVAAQRRVS